MPPPIRLPQTIEEPDKSGLSPVWLGGLLVVMLMGGLIYLKRDSLNLSSFSNTPAHESISQQELLEYIEFARKVDISICNFGFNNLESYLQSNSGYFDQSVLDDFQSNFFTDDLQKKIISQKLYCTVENISALQTEVHGQRVACWFTGTLVYASALSNPPSIIQIPYSNRLLVQKFADGFKVVGFEFVNPQNDQSF